MKHFDLKIILIDLLVFLIAYFFFLYNLIFADLGGGFAREVGNLRMKIIFGLIGNALNK